MLSKRASAPAATTLGILFGLAAAVAIGLGAYLVYVGNIRYGYYSAAIGWLLTIPFLTFGQIVRNKIAESATRNSMPESPGPGPVLSGEKKRLRGWIWIIAVVTANIAGVAGISGIVGGAVLLFQSRSSYAWAALVGGVVLLVASGAMTMRINADGNSDDEQARGADDPHAPIFVTLLAGVVFAAALSLGGASILHFNPIPSQEQLIQEAERRRAEFRPGCGMDDFNPGDTCVGGHLDHPISYAEALREGQAAITPESVREDYENVRQWGWVVVGLGALGVVGGIGHSVVLAYRRTGREPE